MTFEDLKDAVCGETVLISSNGRVRFFVGVVRNQLITLDYYDILMRWEEYEIKNWKIKSKERETIQLYETLSYRGVVTVCDEEGNRPNFRGCNGVDRTNASEYKARIVKPYCKVYADTFEIVKEREMKKELGF